MSHLKAIATILVTLSLCADYTTINTAPFFNYRQNKWKIPKSWIERDIGSRLNPASNLQQNSSKTALHQLVMPWNAFDLLGMQKFKNKGVTPVLT